MSYPNPSFWLVNSNSFHQGLGWIFPIHGFVSKPIGFWIFLVSHSCWKNIFSMLFPSEKHDIWWHGYGSIHINTMFNGMNIHLPAILMFTRGTIGFDTLPYSAISSLWHSCSLPIFRNGASNYSMLQKLQKGHNFIIFFSILPEFSAGLLAQSVRCRRRLSKISSVLRLLQSDGF